jgi:Protein of unknown function (DUF3467)
MSPQSQPQIEMKASPEYRDGYANSVQVRVSVWDFHLTFGTARQDNPDAVEVSNFQGIYLSPQQAKAMWNVLGQNLAQYERTFGTLALEPATPGGPVN